MISRNFTFATVMITAGMAAIFAALCLFANHNVGVSGSALSRILTVSRPDTPTIVLHLVIGYDSADQGAAYQMHYTEHLAWLNAAGDQSGHADHKSNAWTTDLAVGYWLSGEPEDLPDMLRTIGGVFKPITLPRDFSEQEKTILQREYDLRLGDNVNAQANVQMNTFLYQGNAIASSTLGTPTQIAALDYDQARALHDQTHRPENATGS
jgi:predicted Zn-dependent peptidase